MRNDWLACKSFLIGGRFTYAGNTNFASLILPFALVLDAGYRKAMPNVSAWF